MIRQKVELSGPLFQKDAVKVVGDNIRDMMDATAAEMEAAVKMQIAAARSRMPGYTGWTHDTVIGRTESLGGRRWRKTAVVSANSSGMGRREAVRTKAAAAGIERRFHPFRKTATAARRAIRQANLTKGL